MTAGIVCRKNCEGGKCCVRSWRAGNDPSWVMQQDGSRTVSAPLRGAGLKEILSSKASICSTKGKALERGTCGPVCLTSRSGTKTPWFVPLHAVTAF